MVVLDFIRSVQPNPDSYFIISENKNITYKELYSLIKKTSSYFRGIGIKENDIVSLLFENSSEFIITVLSLWQIGAVPVPLNIRLLEHDLTEQINFLNPSLTIKSQNLKDISLHGKVVGFDYKNTSENLEVIPSNFSKEKTALILFTSGSSGKPKAVMLSFNNLVQSAVIGNKILNHNQNERWLASLPFYHIGGFSIFFRAIMFGASVILPQSLSHQHLIEALQKYKPTFVSLVSNQLMYIVDNQITPPDELKTVLLGGGFTDSQLILKAIDFGWKIAKVYGSTETSSFVTFMDTDEVKKKPGASGKAIPPNKIVLTDEGEITIQSPAVMKGYYKNEEESNVKLKDDFYYSGDLGKIDDEGYLFVEAKRNDLIVSGGENINPFEVEEAILSNNKVKEVCVVGINDKQWGQILSAVIVLKEKNSMTENEMKNYLSEKLALYKIPKNILFTEHLPKSGLGKYLREEIKNLFK